MHWIGSVFLESEDLFSLSYVGLLSLLLFPLPQGKKTLKIIHGSTQSQNSFLLFFLRYYFGFTFC